MSYYTKRINLRSGPASLAPLAALLMALLATAAACGGEPRSLFQGASSAPDAEEGAVVYAVGRLEAAPLHDRFFLQPGSYFRFERHVEMFAHYEDVKKETRVIEDKSVDITTSSCLMHWTAEPDLQVHTRSGCAGKRNRQSYVRNESGRAALSIRVGDRVFPIDEAWTLRGVEPYAIQKADIVANQVLYNDAKFFYFDQYCRDAPTGDCERIQLTAWKLDPAATYTVFGRLSGGRIMAAQGESGPHLWILPGDLESALEGL
jgi:hypothetical protein